MNKLNVTFDQLIDDSPIVNRANPGDNGSASNANNNSNGNSNGDPNHQEQNRSNQNPIEGNEKKGEGENDRSNEENSNPNGEGEKNPKGENSEGDEGKGGENEENQQETALKIFQKELGYEVEGEFDEESIDGLLEYTRKAIPVAAKQVLEDVFQEYPEAEMLIKHLNEGHSLDTFVEQFKQPELIKQEITEQTDPAILERIMRENLSAKGLDKDEIDLYVTHAKDTNTLFPKSKKSFDEIKSRHEQTVQAKKQAEADQLKAIQDKQIKTWNTVNELVNSGKVGSAVIPDAEKAKFLEFISKPVKENKTMRELKYEEMTTEDHLYIDYLVYKDAMKRSGNASKQRDSVFEQLMAKRNPGRMQSTSTQSRQNEQSKSSIKNPKESLKGLNFGDLIS